MSGYFIYLFVVQHMWALRQDRLHTSSILERHKAKSSVKGEQSILNLHPLTLVSDLPCTYLGRLVMGSCIMTQSLTSPHFSK